MAYDLGLKNLVYDDSDIHSRTFFITIGYNIAGER
jgi:hypothetical protein